MLTLEEFCEKFDQMAKVRDGIKQLKEENESLRIQVKDTQAYKNALNEMFDGIKIVADPEHPFICSFPMYVKANMFYQFIDKVYVAVKDGIAEDLTDEFFEEWNTDDDSSEVKE